jgi:hypothetical protein
VSTSPYTVRTDDALKVRFSATLGEEPEVEVTRSALLAWDERYAQSPQASYWLWIPLDVPRPVHLPSSQSPTPHSPTAPSPHYSDGRRPVSCVDM